MPVYNTEKYVETAILSVLMQTYEDLELICIDDCSTDSSLEILKRFATLDSRVKILENETNKGLSYNRNLGIENANGEYILFLDSDDWLAFNTLEILFNSLALFVYIKDGYQNKSRFYSYTFIFL